MRIHLKNHLLSVLFVALGLVLGFFLYEVVGEPAAVRSITTNPVSCMLLMAFTGYLVSAAVRKRENA